MTLKRLVGRFKARWRSAVSWIRASKKRQRIAGLASILVFVAAGQIIIASFAATTEYSSIPAIAKMQKLTEEVVTLADEYASMPDTVSGKKTTSGPNNAKAVKKTELVAKVKERKEAYEDSMKYDPQTTADHYLSEATRAKLPEEAKTELEQKVEVNGIWVNGVNEARESFGEDTEATQAPEQPAESQSLNEEYIYIRDATNTDIHLYATALPRIKTGFVVKVKGVRIGNSLAVARPKVQTSPLTSFWSRLVPKVSADAADNPTCKSLLGPIGGKVCETIVDKIDHLDDDIFDQLVFCEDKGSCRDDGSNIDLTGDQGNRKTLVIPMNFKDDQESPLTIAEIDGSYQSLATIYDSMSYGKFKPQYDVYQKWTTISEDDNIVDCNVDELATVQQDLSDATRTTLDKDLDLATKIINGGYSDVMYVYNRLVCDNPDESLGQGGWAAIGYNRGDYLSESVILLTGITHTAGRQWLISAMAHELGHSYGLHHAHGACNEGAPTQDPAELDLTQYCTAEFAEYADLYNIMGQGTPLRDSMSFNFANKARLNWVSDIDDAISVPAEGGQYTINALHKPTGKRALKLRYKGRELYIEYRPKTDEGTDRFVENTMSPGLLAYFSNDDRSTSLLGSESIGETDRTYAAAGRLKPYRIGEGDDSICVLPTNLTEGAVDIDIKKNCGNDALGNAPKFVSSSVIQNASNRWPESTSLGYDDLPAGVMEGDRILAVITAYYTRDKSSPEPAFNLPGWESAGNVKNPSSTPSTSTSTRKSVSNVTVFSWEYKPGLKLPALTAEVPRHADGSVDPINYYRVAFLAYRPSLPVYKLQGDGYASGYLEGEGNSGVFQARFPVWSNRASNATVLHGQFDTGTTTVFSGPGPSLGSPSFGPITTRVDLVGEKDKFGPLRIADSQVHGVYSSGASDAWDRSVIVRGMCFVIMLDGGTTYVPGTELPVLNN